MLSRALALGRRLRIVPRLVIGFATLIVLMLVGFGLGIAASSVATQEIDRTTELRAPATLASARAQADLLQLVADLHAYLALGDTQYKASYATHQTRFESDLDELEAIIHESVAQGLSDSHEMVGDLERLRSNYDRWSVLVPELFELRDDQLRREPALRILIVDAAPLINTVIVNSGSMLRTQEEMGANAENIENIEVMGAMARFQSTFYAMVAGLRGYVTTGRESFAFEYQANLDANDQAWEALAGRRGLLSPGQLVNLGEVERARAAFLLMPDRMFEAVKGEHAREDLYLFRAQAVPLADAMMQSLEWETRLQQDLLQSDLDTGRRQLNRAQVASVAGAVIVILAGLALAWALGRAIARPIVRLTATAQRIQAGDLAAQAEITSEDEIGILGSAFNAMTSQLRATLQSLLDYLEQVKVVMAAAAAVEESRFEPLSLDGLAGRSDALGQLARVFQKMAREVRLREEKLLLQVKELKIVLDESRQKKKVAEITESDYFKSLQSEAESLRGIISGAADKQE